MSAAVLTAEADELHTVFSIGFSESMEGRFCFGAQDALYQDYLTQRKALLMNVDLSGIGVFARRLKADDLRFMQNGVLVPLRLGAKDGYLFLSFAQQKQWDIKELILALNLI